jgi:hypothetical protein
VPPLSGRAGVWGKSTPGRAVISWHSD